MSTRTRAVSSWILRAIAALIMLQTLFYKFSGSEESVYIFSQLGVEPWGRIGSGVAELVASILLLIPATTGIGALLGLSLMAGAIGAHMTILGVEVQNDGGLLFIYALVVFACCCILTIWYRRQLYELFPYSKARVKA